MNNSNISKNLEIIDSFNEAIKYLKSNNLYEKKYQELEFITIYHVYISAVVRVITTKADRNLKKKVITKLIDFVENNYPNYNKNKYIKFLDKNKKIIYNIIRLKQYWIVKLIFKVKNIGV